MDDDWENCDLELVIPNLEQLKERKLVEEADNELTDELFNGVNSQVNGVKLGVNDIKKPPNEEVKAKKRFIKKEEVKEEKSLSKKEKKKLLKRENDLFGEPIYDDEYAEYEDKFHK